MFRIISSKQVHETKPFKYFISSAIKILTSVYFIFLKIETSFLDFLKMLKAAGLNKEEYF